MTKRTHSKATVLAAAGAVLVLSVASITASSAQPAPGTRLCTWGGTPDNPTGVVTIDPGTTNTPSAGPVAVHAWGPLAGPGCQGTMDFDGIGRAGASCESVIFEGPVYGVPGVTRLF